MAGAAQDLPEVPGFRFAAAAAGMRYQGRDDVALIACHPAARWGALLTTNAAPGAPVIRARQLRSRGRPVRAVLVNAGLANAGTGAQGLRDAREIARLAARELGARPSEVLCASTGAIGIPLPMDRFAAVLPGLVAGLESERAGEVARAIMTTDTVPKHAVARRVVDGRPVTILGIAKGAAMVAPDMATMLVFLLTDARLAPGFPQRALEQAAEESFHALTVDDATSTSDMAVLLASGQAGNRPLSGRHRQAATFQQALAAVCLDLTRQIARDGEGATRLIAVTVAGARSRREARAAARGIAGSSLVKAALAGGRPAWGFMVAAMGAAGVAVRAESLAVRCGEVELILGGSHQGAEAEAAARRYLAGEEVEITVDLGLGRAAFTCFTCDLTADYVAINAQG
jgi:glutamate N-acetyltransferase / amino-acid N-acetyltransferase